MKHIAITLLGATLFAAATAQTPPHFSPKGKQPSATTVTQQEALRQATDGAAPDSIVMALDALRRICPNLEASLRRHPPRGLTRQT